MVNALLGKKIGMTQTYDEAGNVVPVSVLQVGPCYVTQVKTDAAGACSAVQIGFDKRKPKNTTGPLRGHFAKAGVTPQKILRDVKPEAKAEFQPGQTLGVGLFDGTAYVDVTGISKGRGFTGVMKRHGFAGGHASHGAAKVHRRPGSIGQHTDPGRVHKGRRMAGHMGAARVTLRNLKVVKLDEAQNLMLVRGAVPGYNGAYVLVRKAKAPHKPAKTGAAEGKTKK